MILMNIVQFVRSYYERNATAQTNGIPHHVTLHLNQEISRKGLTA